MHIHRFALLLGPLFVAGLVVACGPADEPDVTRTDDGVLRLGSVEAVDTVSRAVDLKGRPLVLEGMRGSVYVRGDSGSTARFSFVRRGRGDRPDAARDVLDGIRVIESGTEGSYTFTLTAEDEDAYTAVDIRGHIPEEAALRIDRVSGPVWIVGVFGPLTIRHDYGGVDVQGAVGPADIDITGGDLRVGFRTLPENQLVELRTGNGDIALGLPAGASALLDAQTLVGEIRTRGVSLTPERFGPIEAGAGYEARMGTGGPTLILRTENGSITIHRADTSGAPFGARPNVMDTTALPLSDTTVMPAPPPTAPADTMPADTTLRDTTGSER